MSECENATADRIATLEAEVLRLTQDRDEIEKAIIDASNGSFPPQGQADPEDEIDGLAWFIEERRKLRRAALAAGEGS